jgi:hypothetical protein
MATEHLHTKFEHLLKVISSEKFLKMEALGGEIPFWISAYSPSQEVEVDIAIGNLQRRLENEGINALVVDLFSLSMEIIEEHIGLEALFAIEHKKKKETFKRALQSTINIHERLIPQIKLKVENEQPRVLLIKGVGKVFPFIRSHNVLNNLQSAVKEIPSLMFFPGAYTGQTLKLFNLLKDDNYYRAFNIQTTFKN